MNEPGNKNIDYGIQWCLFIRDLGGFEKIRFGNDVGAL
jgi:hypothetical protein